MTRRGYDGRIHVLKGLGTMNPISLHDRVIDLHKKGMGPTEIAGRVACSRMTVHRHLEKAAKEELAEFVPLPRVIGEGVAS